jgi:hypothetical protein
METTWRSKRSGIRKKKQPLIPNNKTSTIIATTIKPVLLELRGCACVAFQVWVGGG